MKRKLLTIILGLAFISNVCANNYSNGVFIVNEDWFGHGNSTVNFFKNGEWNLRVIAEANGGIRRLGATACDGKIYGDKFYIISKQANDGGDADQQGGRLVVVDASTMELKSTLADIDPNGDKADGRSIVIINEQKAYVSTSKGVYIYNPSTNTVSSKLAAIDASQSGSMLKACGKVFIVNQSKGLYVINPDDDSLIKLFSGTDIIDKGTFGSIVRSKDGFINASVVNSSGTSFNKILRINPATLATSLIDLDVKGPNAAWGAWTPTTFCGSVKSNVLFWTNGSSVGTSGYFVYRYDIDTNTATTLINVQEDGAKNYIYGAAIRVSPVDESFYICETIGGPYTNNVSLYVYDKNGANTGIYPLPEYYWFPGVPVFTDDCAPIVNEMPTQHIQKSTTTRIPLSDFVSDNDNLACEIEKIVVSVTDNGVLSEAYVDYSENLLGDLVVVTTDVEGTADVVLDINSNGKTTTATATVSTSDSSVETITDDNKAEAVYYDINGRRLQSAPTSPGVYILRQDSSTKKILLK